MMKRARICLTVFLSLVLLLSAVGFMKPAQVEAATGTLELSYRYGTNSLIQVNTNLPSDTPIVNFLATDNGCKLIQRGSTFGYVEMANVEGTIVLTFRFNGAFAAGSVYSLGRGSVFGFTNGSTYTLDKEYSFAFDGSGWTMLAMDPLELTYRWGAGNVIQFNTNLPSDTPIKDFPASADGCAIFQSGDQQVSYISMANANGTIVLTFNFNGAFTAGQKYALGANSIITFTNGKTYTLNQRYAFAYDGENWTVDNVDPTLNVQYRWGNSTLIQINTDLPVATPLADFTTGQNGCSIDQSINTAQHIGYVQMNSPNETGGTIVLTLHFNSAFTAGQEYILPAYSIIGFADGSKYVTRQQYTFKFNGTDWTMTAQDPQLTLDVRYGTPSTLQLHTNLSINTMIEGLSADLSADSEASFLWSDYNCSVDESNNPFQQVGWLTLKRMGQDQKLVLTFNFNKAFEIGQRYVLKAGSVFRFENDFVYTLDRDYTFWWDGYKWTEEPIISFQLRDPSGDSKKVSVTTYLPLNTPCANFLATDNGCSLIQDGNQQVGWIGMGGGNAITFDFHFNGAFTHGQKYILEAGSIFGFTNGVAYRLSQTHVFTWDANEQKWTLDLVAPELVMTYRYGTDKLIQYNTNLPSDTPCVNFLAGDNGCNLLQSGAQNVGWIQMDNLSGTIVLTFHFNKSFAYGESYTVGATSLFGFTDGSEYSLYNDVTYYWDGTDGKTWVTQQPCIHVEVVDAYVAPTCTATGLTEGKHCSACGKVFVAQQEIAATGHSYVSTVTPPTCTDQGYTTHVCSGCGDTYVDTYVDAKGHSYESTAYPATADANAYIEHICSVCHDSYTVDLAFYSGSLTLENTLIINYNVLASVFDEGNFENPYVVFSYGNRVEDFNGEDLRIVVCDYETYTNAEGKLCYRFACPQITPSQIGDQVTAVLHASYNGKDYTHVNDSYSVAQYCYSQLEKSNDAKLKTLLVDLLGYCDAARIYTTYKADQMVSDRLTAEQKALGTTQDRTLTSVLNAKYAVVSSPKATWKAASVVMYHSVAMRFRFEAASIEGLSVKVEMDGKSYTINNTDFESAGGNNYYVFFDQMNAYQMSENVYVTVYEGDTAVSNTVCYSVESYVYAKQNDANAKLAALVKALMRYGDSAVRYRNK